MAAAIAGTNSTFCLSLGYVPSRGEPLTILNIAGRGGGPVGRHSRYETFDRDYFLNLVDYHTVNPCRQRLFARLDTVCVRVQ